MTIAEVTVRLPSLKNSTGSEGHWAFGFSWGDIS